MNEPERYGTCSDGNGHWGIEDDGKVILSGLVSHDACDAVMDILDERDALKAEVERLTVSLKVSHDAINASEKVLGKHQVRECIDESVNSWGCVDLPASIKGLVRKLEVADNHAQALEMVINAGTANELRLKAEVERLTAKQTDIDRVQAQSDFYRSKLIEKTEYAQNIQLLDQVKHLEAQVERLTKAGDAMANNIPYYADVDISAETLRQFTDKWLAAKEGKPHA